MDCVVDLNDIIILGITENSLYAFFCHREIHRMTLVLHNMTTHKRESAVTEPGDECLR